MRIIVFSTLFLLTTFSNLAIGQDCECIGYSGKKQFFQKQTKSEKLCDAELYSWFLNQHAKQKICKGNQDILKIQYTCHRKGEPFKLRNQEYGCQKIDDMFGATQVAAAVAYSQVLSDENNIDPTEMIRSDNCEDAIQKSITDKIKDPAEGKIILNIKDKADLKNTLGSILVLNKQKLPAHILDDIENAAVTFWIHNDNNWFNGGSGGNDIGNTHGMKLEFTKNLKGTGYQLTISYETNLYTNWSNPANPSANFRLAPDGGWLVTQFFIEENIAKVMLEKKKQGDAFYWSASGGIHQLNKDDPDGAFGIGSALGSQRWLHSTLNNHQAGSARHYDNLPQFGESEVAPMVEGSIGKRTSLMTGQDTRVFLKTEGSARLTGVSDASYVGGDTGIFVDRRLIGSSAVRAGFGYQAKVYSDQTTQDSKYFEVIVGTKHLEAGFRYDWNSGLLPGYQNALPVDFENRDELQQEDQNIWQVYIKGKW